MSFTIWTELREDIEDAHRRAASAYAAIGDNLMHGAGKADAMYSLTEALRAARDDLGRLSRLLEETPEPERPDHEASVYDDATHVIAGTGFVHIEDGQNQRYAVGELCREGDELPWKVVELKPGEAPSILFEFPDREEAEDCRDALNTGAFTPLMDMDPEHEPITGPTDAEEAALARADHERVRMASEGEEA